MRRLLLAIAIVIAFIQLPASAWADPIVQATTPAAPTVQATVPAAPIAPAIGSLQGPGPLGLWPEVFAKPKVLIFCKTNGYHHASISTGIAAIQKLGAENGFLVDTTADSTWFRPKILKRYAALIFLSPTGKVFGPQEEQALEGYIHHGGGFVGIHAATDCEYNWQWYGDLVGGYFKSHPKQQEARFYVVDSTNAAMQGFPNPWTHLDELYNFKYLNPDIKVLLKIDETSYEGGANGDNHPFAWYHEYEGGRSFYTALGHRDEDWTDPLFLHHVLAGIRYAMGKK